MSVAECHALAGVGRLFELILGDDQVQGIEVEAELTEAMEGESKLKSDIVS